KTWAASSPCRASLPPGPNSPSAYPSPLPRQRPKRRRSPASPNMRTSSSRGTILFVDDESRTRKYFERAFGEDFNILTAADATEAMRILESQGDRIAVLLTDQRMPKGDGVSLLQEARRRYPHIIRLLTTAYVDIDDAIAAVNRGEV